MFQQLRMKASSRFQQAGVKGGEKRPARKLAGVLSTRLEELLYSAAKEAVCGGIYIKIACQSVVQLISVATNPRVMESHKNRLLLFRGGRP